jgi:coenzyme F420-reducing hydrogenase delta subunit
MPGSTWAGVSRIQYPPNARIIRVMCSGMVHPDLVINALTRGAGRGVGCVEAPRGNLTHYYECGQDGLITKVNLIVAPPPTMPPSTCR